MEPRHVFLRFLLDANRINAAGRLPAMNQLEQWHEAEVIELMMAEITQAEAAHGHAGRARKAYTYIFTMTAATTAEERAELAAIERILFPAGARTPNERNDVEAVFNAAKYGAILVTADGGSKTQPGGILGHRDELRAAVGVRILTDTEAVALVRERIANRDEICRLDAATTGEQLPEWVGSD